MGLAVWVSCLSDIARRASVALEYMAFHLKVVAGSME